MLNEVSERLADQLRQIKIKKWLENVEQDDTSLRVSNEHKKTEHSSTDASNRNRTLEARKTAGT